MKYIGMRHAFSAASFLLLAVAVCAAGTCMADTARARYVRLTVTASRPAPSEPPFYGGRSWQICDWTLMRGGKALGWSGAKVLQPDRGLVKGEGPAAWAGDGERRGRF